jgi:hypothetical protein
LRRLTIELRKTEIDPLVRMGLLKIEMRNDANAIAKALYGPFRSHLGFNSMTRNKRCSHLNLRRQF